MGLLDGRVAVITGAGGGLGRSHALAMAREGADIVVNDLAPARDGAKDRPAELVCQEVRALGRRAVANYDDISSMEGAAKLVAQARTELGGIHILVNNAGILRDKTLKKLTEAEWDLVLKVHAKGTFACSQAAALAFAEQGKGGRIINTSSVAGLRGNFGQTNYAAAKAGIYGMTRVHSMELAKDGVTVNAIAPIAKTDMTKDLEAVADELKPEMVSPLVVFLASDLGADVTGRVFGCHGNHYFEYEVRMSEGVKRSDLWTPSEVAAKLAEIGRFEAPPAASGGAGGGGGGPADLVEAAFANIAQAFLKDKAAGWNAVVAFDLAGGGQYTVRVKDQTVATEKGKAADATCVVTMDVATMAGMIDGSVDGNQAFMKGKIKATKLPDLGKFGKVFQFRPAFVAELKSKGGGGGGAAAGGGASGGAMGPAQLVKATFDNLASAFKPEKAQGWATVMSFVVDGGDAFTVRVADGKVATEAGKAADATCVVTTDLATMAGMIDGSVDGNQAFMKGKIKATKLPDMAKFGKAFPFDAAFLARIKGGGAPAGASGSQPAASQGPDPAIRLRALVAALPKAFEADKAKGYKGNLWFEVASGDSFAVLLDDGTCKIEATRPDKVACTVNVDAATLAGVFDGSIKGEDALKDKKLVAKPPTGLLKFRQCFRFGPELLAELAAAAAPVAAEAPAEEGEGLVNPKAVGKKFRGKARFARPEAIQGYADATNDRNSRYRIEAGEAQIGSPLFPVTFVMDLFMEAMTDKDLGIDMSRVVHGEQEIRYLKPVKAWDLVNPRAKVTSIQKKSSGWLVDVTQTLLVDGEPVVEMVSGIFVRGFKKGEDGKKSEKTQPEALPQPKYTRDSKVDADQSERYAKASGDDNPIHLDAEFARSVGLPDRILHGLCTMAMAAGSLVDSALGGDPARLKSIKVRFSKPVLMGDTLTTNVWEVARADRRVTLGFEVKSPRGDAVITNGLAEILD